MQGGAVRSQPSDAARKAVDATHISKSKGPHQHAQHPPISLWLTHTPEAHLGTHSLGDAGLTCNHRISKSLWDIR